MNITAGIYKGRKIISPDEKITRPTLSKTRMGIFNSLYSLIGDFEGKSFLDVFGGSGIMGLEAISRGFSTVKVFEKNKSVADIIKKNYASLGIKPDLTIGDSLKLVRQTEHYFNVIYIDPPYESGIYEKILSVVKGDIIIVESSKIQSYENFDILKQKKYSSSYVTFLVPKSSIKDYCKIS